MPDLTRQRCLNHPEREAAARCPECGQYFCRECVTEHDARVVCATCLRRLAGSAWRTRERMAGALRALTALALLMLSWLFFYGLGQALLWIPSDFHEGAVWERIWGAL